MIALRGNPAERTCIKPLKFTYRLSSKFAAWVGRLLPEGFFHRRSHSAGR